MDMPSNPRYFHLHQWSSMGSPFSSCVVFGELTFSLPANVAHSACIHSASAL